MSWANDEAQPLLETLWLLRSSCLPVSCWCSCCSNPIGSQLMREPGKQPAGASPSALMRSWEGFRTQGAQVAHLGHSTNTGLPKVLSPAFWVMCMFGCMCLGTRHKYRCEIFLLASYKKLQGLSPSRVTFHDLRVLVPV